MTSGAKKRPMEKTIVAICDKNYKLIEHHWLNLTMLKEPMSDEDYALIEHPRLELHLHVATKFVQVIKMRMVSVMRIMMEAGQ